VAADEWDVIRWEHVALRLARAAGIRVAHNELLVVDGKPVLVVDRFDRSDSRRLGYASAMTVLEATDGDDGSEARIDLLWGVASMFRLTEVDAQTILGEVVNATGGWRGVADEAGLDGAAIDRMARAFVHEENDRARQLIA
jgi:HipA-like C-terminal domain